MSEQEKRHHNANAKGAVNLVAGMIQLAGGSIAFPTQGETIDLYAIIGGQQHSIIVRSGRHIELSLHAFNVPINHSSSVVLFVSQHTETSYSIYRVPTELIEGGDKKGGYVELEALVDEKHVQIGAETLPSIVSFKNLDGERTIRRRS
ncbi:MAG: hypothetical protein DI537_20490 [Stutzerimonas stutzeri]|nr:MAG: hypothetical protein DI537_20490 [Stutzerimonas stutzeri]